MDSGSADATTAWLARYVEVFETFPRTPSLKVVKRDVVTAILERSRTTA